ncbi:FKBP-type peptidyl-prolyl cis-trans isomerase [Pseudomonas sp. NPDC007930]|uniref:FKBP-type peptidyl-prolyl cis-trans isomerase n=1 Tax=Pseudomonas sp. NPDC007930 TaxID=3364417 RepID=UPI0036E1AC1A
MSDTLIIEDLLEGTGKAAVKGALITTHYQGWLADGSLFDSLLERGKAFQCVIGTGRVIKGWDQGLMGMRVGGKRRLRVPAALAYAERGMGSRVPPGADLTFEVELLEVLTRDD